MAKAEGKGKKKKDKKAKKGKKDAVEKLGIENIRIDLERTSGVYFAGEVVRGTVRMNCNEPVECLGVHFQFTGQAKVNWSEPSTADASDKGNKSSQNEKTVKKSRVDDEASHDGDEEGQESSKKGDKKADAGPSKDVYNGVTMFQSDRQTVMGDIYKTGVFNEGWVASEGDMEIPYDDANPDIDFDPIPGLGVVNIPCSHKETTSNNLPLILRVMEHNWKTEKEVALAELLLDVNESPPLTDCKDIQQYPLTELVKKKKHKKKKKKDHSALIGISAKWLPHNAVFPTGQKTSNNNNEEFFGSSLLQQNDWCLVLRIHQITGLRSEVMLGQKYYVQVYKETSSTAAQDYDEALPSPDTLQLVTLPKGASSTPFVFTVLPTAPGSAEFGVRGGDAAQKAVVRYDVRVHIDRNSSLDPSSKKVITVIPNRPLPKPILLKPHSSFTEPQKIYGRCHNYSCLKSCFQDGIVSINFCIDRRCYAPGEIVDITGSDVKHSSKHDLKVDIILLTTFQIGIPGKTQLDHQETILGTLTVPSMKKREEMEEVEADEPYDSAKKRNRKKKAGGDGGDDEEEGTERNFEDSTTIKRLVDGEFVVTEEAKPKSMKKKKSEPFIFKFPEPIRIPPTFPSFDGGVEQDPIEMEEAQSSRSKKKKEKLRYPCVKWTYELQIRANMPVGEDFAACSIPMLVTSVPPYTHILEEFQDAEIEDEEGSQDEEGNGIGLWKILDHGFNGSYFTAPTVTGPEKHGGTLVNAGNVVYTFDQIVDANHVGGRFKFQPMVNSFDGPTESIFRNENPAPDNNKKTSSLLLSMVKDMRKSSDKREIFGTWIRDHTEHTHKLKPQDIGGILSRGTFNAFDQPSLVWELKAAFDTEDSSPLTCAHIVAAMNACKYRMVEVATMLAPIASDWEEKMDTVLDLIEDNIGRDAVEQSHYANA